jgi:hypothetical protein
MENPSQNLLARIAYSEINGDETARRSEEIELYEKLESWSITKEEIVAFLQSRGYIVNE